MSVEYYVTDRIDFFAFCFELDDVTRSKLNNQTDSETQCHQHETIGRSHFLHLEKTYHFLHLVFLILKHSNLSGVFGILEKKLKSGENGVFK